MKHEQRTRRYRRGRGGFSLVEMLIVIAVIGIVSAIAVPSIGSINDKANQGKSRRNAQNLCSLFQAARSVGTEFVSADKEGILDEMIEGKDGPEVGGSRFKMSELSDEEKLATLGYCSYDAEADLMLYNQAGGEGDGLADAGGGGGPLGQPDPEPAPASPWKEFRAWSDQTVAQNDVNILLGHGFYNHPTGHYSNALPWRVGAQKPSGDWPVEYYLED